MKKILIIVIATLHFTLTVKGQNLFLIGEKSYSCTQTITLQSNSDEFYINDLNVSLAKDGNLKRVSCIRPSPRGTPPG